MSESVCVGSGVKNTQPRDKFPKRFNVLFCLSGDSQIGESSRLGVIEKSTIMMWNWQTLSIILAGTMCLLFLLTVVCIYWQHSRYWKKLETMDKGYTAGL